MRALALFSACLLLTACGDLADDTDSLEPLAVLHGQLTNPGAVSVGSGATRNVRWCSRCPPGAT